MKPYFFFAVWLAVIRILEVPGSIFGQEKYPDPVFRSLSQSLEENTTIVT
jgi:hypothetical protein